MTAQRIVDSTVPRAAVPLAALALAAACGDNLARPPEPFCDAWHQWGNNEAHTGTSCAVGQPLDRVIADVVYDPLAPTERGTSGDLVVHYQVPLIDGDRVFMMTKHGSYTPCLPTMDPAMRCNQPGDLYRLDSQIWAEVGYAWDGDTLAPQWTFESDWVPPADNETMFQPVLLDDRIVIPAASGALWELDAATGAIVRHLAPLGLDPDTYVVGALAVDHGVLYYNAIKYDHDQPYKRARQSWLIAIEPDGRELVADYAQLVPGAPGAYDGCYWYYDPNLVQAPWPPPSNADGTPVLPKKYGCGDQEPGANSAPAFAFDGTLYVVTHAQFNENYSYIVSISPTDLSPNWAASLRDRLHDGCGVTVPYAADAPPDAVSICRDGAPPGVDPSTGLLPAAAVDDASSSSPIALPHGGVLYGALTYYNGERGHLVAFEADGKFTASYDFGWDTTPAVISDGATDRIVVKDNHYELFAAGTAGPYYMTELDRTLEPIWQFQNTETQSCARQPDGTISCMTDHPWGFEWCINAPAVDRDGTIYGNSEDGHLYAITADGQLRDRIFLDAALGASYTPLSIDARGRIYALNNGHLFVVGAKP